MLPLLFASIITTAFATCIDKDEIEWTAFNNQIYLNGEQFNMKGLSWFGFETWNYNLYGLDYHSMDWYFEWMTSNGFNTIRMPFSSDYLNEQNGWDTYIKAVMAAGDKGLFVMLDMHSKTPGAWTDGLDTINQATEVTTWKTLASKLVDAGAWNVIMVDVFNEPHDVSNSEWGDWLGFCEDVAEAVWDAGLNALIAVEGTNSDCSPISCCWGENLTGVRDRGLTFSASKSNKLVWSPHVYYGDVTGNWVYSDDGWENHWGYLVESTDAPIVIGEFGTKTELTWLGDLIDYLGSIKQRNHFFWCLNPNSGDTGGLLQDDWTTSESAKLELLAELQPSPSTVSVSSSEICVDGLGESATPASTSSTTTTTSSGGSSSGGQIKIMQNEGVNIDWYAIEFPDNDNSAIKLVEFRDSNHGSWMSGTWQSWGAWAWDNSQGQFNGNQHFRVTTNDGQKATWNVFTGLSKYSTAYIDLPGSSFTEEEETSSGLTASALAAVIICALLCVVCIGVGLWFYKKNHRLNKGKASFETTADTPEPSQNKADTPSNEDPEIEVEMNVEDGQTITQQ